jgi:hypothetical protein
MGQPVAEVIAIMMQEDLGLVLEPAKGGGMDNPVTVALKFGARRARPGAMETPEGKFGFAGVGSGIAHRYDKALFILGKSYYFSLTVMTLRTARIPR